MNYAVKQDDESRGEYFVIYDLGDNVVANLYYTKVDRVIRITNVELEQSCDNMDLVDIARKIFACDDLEGREIRIGKEVTKELGFEDRECIFQIEELLQGHSIVLVGEPIYIGGEIVAAATVGSLSDARYILSNPEVLYESGIDIEAFYIKARIVKNIRSIR